MKAVKVAAIAAMDEGRVIGKDNQLPWRIKEDMQRFAALTTGHTVLMGRKTYESLPPKFKPLPNRKNIVISRTLTPQQSIEVWDSVETCLKAYLEGQAELQGSMLWIIGGGQIYQETLPWWDELYLTMVHSKNAGDAFFPRFEEQFDLRREDRKDGYSFQDYVRK